MEKSSSAKPNRREFLYYMGGASLALLGVGSIGLLARFLNPPPDYGWDSGIFLVDTSKIPQPTNLLIELSDGYFYLSRINSDVIALDAYCPLRPGGKILLRWVPTNNRFECPRCGSKFRRDGTYIEGPSQRGLDRFVVEVTTPDGIITTPPDGSPVSIEGATQIVVDTNRVIYGQRREG